MGVPEHRAPAASIRRLRPLTERVLARFPGPRAAGIAVWALVPWLNAGANLLLPADSRTEVWEQSGALVVLNYAALSAAVVLTVWGADHIARRVEELPARTSTLRVDASQQFAEIKNTQEAVDLSALGQQLFDKLALLPVPSLAIIHGATLGGGSLCRRLPGGGNLVKP